MYVKDSETEIRKRCVRKIWLMWYIMAIFIFIGHIMLELIWETDKWSEIYKHTSLTHDTTNDVCLQNNELKRKNISSIFTVAAMRGIFIIKTFLCGCCGQILFFMNLVKTFLISQMSSKADVVKSLGSLVITNWAKCYYKLIQGLEIKATAIKKGDSY